MSSAAGGSCNWNSRVEAVLVLWAYASIRLLTLTGCSRGLAADLASKGVPLPPLPLPTAPAMLGGGTIVMCTVTHSSSCPDESFALSVTS